jgi:hypothetical protein
VIAPVASLAQVAAFTRGYGRTRYQSGSGQTEYPDGKLHLARDFYLPPGSPIYTPVAGMWDHWGASNEDGSLGMGWVGVFDGDDGVRYRFIHIASAGRNEQLPRGGRVSALVLIGYTPKGNLGASESHLHLDTARGGVRFDPVDALGVAGFNRMILGPAAPGASSRRPLIVLAASAVVGVAAFAWFRRSSRRRLDA